MIFWVLQIWSCSIYGYGWTTPYRDIRLTLCGVNSVEAILWLKIVCSTELFWKHIIDVTRDRVVFIYYLVKGFAINEEDILR